MVASRPIILLVEQDRLIAQMYQRKFADLGYRVVHQIDGPTALTWLNSHTPQLVILEILLPGMNGLAVLKAIRRTTRLQNCPIVILTNLSAIDVGLKLSLATSLGVSAYLVKAQHTPDEVAKQVQRLIKAAGATHAQL